MIPLHLERCVCSHPRAIHIGGGVCVRCACGRFAASAAGFTREERLVWENWLQTEAA